MTRIGGRIFATVSLGAHLLPLVHCCGAGVNDADEGAGRAATTVPTRGALLKSASVLVAVIGRIKTLTTGRDYSEK